MGFVPQVLSKKYLERYTRVKIRDPQGKVHYSYNNKDPVSKQMFGMNRAEMIELGKINRVSERMEEDHGTKNDGHYRMILGQVLRMRILRNYPVRIGDVVITSMEQQVPWRTGYSEEPINLDLQAKARAVAQEVLERKKRGQ